METSDRALDAILAAAFWTVAIITVRFVLRRAFARYERRLAEKDPAVAARRRTTFSFLLRVVIALTVLLGVWSVLSIFPATTEIASAFLASSAVLAIIAGLALTTPLGNLGSGVLLAFTQPVRLGDRVTIDDHTGVVDQMTLSYTALATDEGRRVFVPNTRMVSTTLVNRSVDDPRRLVTVRLPVRLGGGLAQAREVAFAGASRAAPGVELDLDVRVGEIAEQAAWLEVVAYAPFGADVGRIASDVREHALDALADADLLPA
jgi:small-conductance mechanosensitive channel